MKRFISVLFLFVLFLQPAFAVKVPTLYQVEMPVDSQLEEERAQVVTQAFIQLLMRLTGDPNIANQPLIKENLNKAGYFVQEYSYANPDTSVSSYTIHLRFSPDDINRLLRDAGVAYWGDERPLILVWLSVKSPSQESEIVGNDVSNDLTHFINILGKRYGLPLIFPMMDVTDVSQISAADVSAMSLKPIQEASLRYKPDVLLIGNMTIEPTNIQSQWQLILGSNKWDYAVAGKTPKEVVASVIRQVGQTLSQHYVVKVIEVPKLWLKLEVSNIAQRSDLAELMKYLKQLGLVQQIQLSQVSGDVVELSILIRGSQEVFQKNAVDGHHLVFKSLDQPNNKLIYSWVR